MRLVGTAILMMALWLLMSGIYKPLIIGFGVISVVITLWITRRMDRTDNDAVELNLGLFKSISYFGWLMVEIVKANWAVIKIILSPKMAINQHMFHIDHTQKTDVGQVIFANSITLTPGTIAVETETGGFLIHAVSYSSDDLDALADMDARVTKIEAANDV
ncbi:MAG: Na+/H+ antiporter subunit E [Rhizobiaceae bacterium]|nr:Na+/H+ antiporter subunit E [Rhizobiaceae bacterium]